MSSFTIAHQGLSHALVALANPYSAAFSDVRNSSVKNIQSLRECNTESMITQVTNLRDEVIGMTEMVGRLAASRTALIECRESIDSILNKAAQQKLDTHTAIFEESDDSAPVGGGWDEVGSDEEIIA